MGHAAGRSHGDPAVFIRCTPLLSSFSLSTGLIFDFQRIFLSFFLCFEGEREIGDDLYFFLFFLGRKEERKEGMIFRGGLSNGSKKFLREHFSFLSFSSVFFFFNKKTSVNGSWKVCPLQTFKALHYPGKRFFVYFQSEVMHSRWPCPTQRAWILFREILRIAFEWHQVANII